MDIKKEMLFWMAIIGYISFTCGFCIQLKKETECLEKETEILVNQIVDNLEEIYLQQQNQE